VSAGARRANRLKADFSRFAVACAPISASTGIWWLTHAWRHVNMTEPFAISSITPPAPRAAGHVQPGMEDPGI
jgi:hypothetical protein